jgi:hypothetical protein
MAAPAQLDQFAPPFPPCFFFIPSAPSLATPRPEECEIREGRVDATPRGRGGPLSEWARGKQARRSRPVAEDGPGVKRRSTRLRGAFFAKSLSLPPGRTPLLLGSRMHATQIDFGAILQTASKPSEEAEATKINGALFAAAKKIRTGLAGPRWAVSCTLHSLGKGSQRELFAMCRKLNSLRTSQRTKNAVAALSFWLKSKPTLVTRQFAPAEQGPAGLH